MQKEILATIQWVKDHSLIDVVDYIEYLQSKVVDVQKYDDIVEGYCQLVDSNNELEISECMMKLPLEKVNEVLVKLKQLELKKE